MKILIACFLSLALTATVVVVVGKHPTQVRWGDEGVRSLYAVSVICLGAALVGIVPLAVIAATRPAYIGHAALSGTAIRLLATLAGGGIYQTLAKPHLPSFLFWAVINYCVLLVIETGFSVYMTRRSMASCGPSREVPA